MSVEDYFVGVDDREIARLGDQHEAWLPATRALWAAAGFCRGAHLIDLGSGPGFTTFDLAELVGPAGTVCALDKAGYFLQHIERQAVARSITNVLTLNADLVNDPVAGTFDGAFCRWFLAFLRDDLAAVLENIHGCLRQGGTFAAMEYLTLGSLTSAPRDPAFDAYTHAWELFYADNGGDTNVGANLPLKLARTGFEIANIQSVGGLARPGDRWWGWWGRLICDFGPRFVEIGLLDADEWVGLQEHWRRLSSQPGAFIHTPLMIQIVARRAR